MSAEGPAVVARSPHASCSISNDPLKPLPGSDGRSSWSRRRRDLIASFSAELGRPLVERDRVLVANVASIIVRIEQLHVSIANGEPIDDDQLIRLSNLATRLLAAVGLGKAAKAVPPARSLSEYLTSVAGDAA